MARQIKERLQRILDNTDIISEIGKYIPLKKHNSCNYIGICPFHDEKTPSFTVTDKRGGFFKCFGCGESGDVIDFISKIKKISFTAALDTLDNTSTSVNTLPINKRGVVNKDEKNALKVIKPPFELNELPIHYKNGMPDVKYEYRFPDGKIAFYTFRFNNVSGKKEVLPYSYVENINNGVRQWQWKAMKKDVPLYNSHLIGSNKTIILVEGEKTADFGNNILKESGNNNNVFISWLGGTNGFFKSDWSVLNGRNIVAIPDNDFVGIKSMLLILSKIKYKTVKFIVNKNNEKGWDIADTKGWNILSLYRYIKENTIPLPIYDKRKKEIDYGEEKI